MAQHRDRISRTSLRGASGAMAVLLVLGAMTTQSAQAQTFTVLYNFTGGSDGGSPYAGLVRDAAGNLYGTTSVGGSYYYGAVFKLAGRGASLDS